MKRTGAFTLAELLIALAITLVLVVLLANVVSATMNAWQQGRNRLDTFATARQLIGRIQDEIGAAIAAKGSIEFVENDSAVGSSIAGKAENVFFVTPYPNLGAGDLCVIMYRLNTDTHQLERRFKDSAAAWSIDPADRYKVGKYPDSHPTEWRPIADGVMEFEIQSYDTNHTHVPKWDSRTSGPNEGKTPRRVVLRLKVVDDRTLVRLAAIGPNNPQYGPMMKRAARDFFADFSLPQR